MKTFIEIVLIAICAVFFAEIAPIPWIRSKIGLKPDSFGTYPRLKPFDCPLCLAWWTGLVYFFLIDTWYMAPIYAAACSLLAVFISKIIKP